MRISVVIPAFNEEGNIGRLIEETYAEVPQEALGEVLVGRRCERRRDRSRNQGAPRQISLAALSPARAPGGAKCGAEDGG